MYQTNYQPMGNILERSNMYFIPVQYHQPVINRNMGIHEFNHHVLPTLRRESGASSADTLAADQSTHSYIIASLYRQLLDHYISRYLSHILLFN